MRVGAISASARRLAGVERRGRVPGQARALDDAADQGIAVGVRAGGAQADQEVAGLLVVQPRQHRRRGRPRRRRSRPGRSRPRAYMPGISAVSPPTRAQPAWRQPSAMPATTARGGLHVQLAGGVVVEEHQRLGALGQQVVDAHGHQVDADRVVEAGLDGDLQLGADAVGGGDQQRVVVAGRLQVEQRAEAAQRRLRARPAGGLGQRLDRLDQGVARRRCRRRPAA